MIKNNEPLKAAKTYAGDIKTFSFDIIGQAHKCRKF